MSTGRTGPSVSRGCDPRERPSLGKVVGIIQRGNDVENGDPMGDVYVEDWWRGKVRTLNS